MNSFDTTSTIGLIWVACNFPLEPARSQRMKMANFPRTAAMSGRVYTNITVTATATKSIEISDLTALYSHILKIQTFAEGEYDDDTPVEQKIIDMAVNLVKTIHSSDHLFPYFSVPTNSGGVAIEYRHNHFTYYYQIGPTGRVIYTVLDPNNDLRSENKFDSAENVPTPSASDSFQA
jgi:hypothetical protein